MTSVPTGGDRRGARQRLLQGVAFVLRGSGAGISSLLILAVFFAGAFGYAWKNWGVLVKSHPRYTLVPDNLEITPQPEWIRSNVKIEVIRDGNLGTLSLLDPQVTLKVARAFGVHSWVASVRRVRKEYPSRVIVELEYRRPVAMVEVVTNDQRGLLPVDAEGVLLPPREFNESQIRDYLRVSAGNTLPAGPAGTPWGDPRVAGGAAVAAAFGSQWKTMGLYRIVAEESDRVLPGRSPEVVFSILTRDGARVIWGHAPGQETNTEAAAQAKVTRLARYLEKHGPLRTGPGANDLDLRDAGGITVHPVSMTRSPSDADDGAAVLR